LDAIKALRNDEDSHHLTRVARKKSEFFFEKPATTVQRHDQ
jgi:hypothetical protein